jgi:hypothetical protein
MKKFLIAPVLIAALSSSVLTANASTSTATTAPAATTASITLASTHNQSMATATIHINWAGQTQDQLALKWTSPVGVNKGDCHDSTVKIKTGQTVLKSSRVLWYQSANGAPVACTGIWTATVVNTTTGQTLASAQYNNAIK